jgi:hypothetical protein
VSGAMLTPRKHLALRGGHDDAPIQHRQSDIEDQIELIISEERMLDVQYKSDSVSVLWRDLNCTDLKTLLQHCDESQIIYSPRKNVLAWHTDNQSILLLDIENKTQVKVLHEISCPNGEGLDLAFSKEGDILALRLRNYFWQWDVRSGVLISETLIEGAQTAVSFELRYAICLFSDTRSQRLQWVKQVQVQVHRTMVRQSLSRSHKKMQMWRP